MKILLLGGTGAMGIPLTNILSADGTNIVYVTTRSPRESRDNVIYFQGNAREREFLQEVLARGPFDAIFDFMVYSTEELKSKLPMLLNNTKQYFFFSSSRCYAKTDGRITEESPRLVDTCTDAEYLSTDEYGLAKGREENLLIQSGENNWTIIRPYITYNTYRIQLGVYEKENWLRRALAGRTIVFPKDIAERKTSLTYAPDVAGALVKLIGNEKAFGETFHITTEETHTWFEILSFYCDIIERETGKRPKIKIVDNSTELQTVWSKWQIRYDRLYDRAFDNTKIEAVRGEYIYKPVFEGLEECLTQFIAKPVWLGMNVRFEAWCDRQTGEWTPLSEIKGKKAKLRYLKWRILG